MAAFFVVGGSYQDRRGEYVVLSISGNDIVYRHEDGSVKRDLASVKERIHLNMVDEQGHAHPTGSGAYFETLGVMAATADFQAEVPPQSRPGFEQEYLRLTGLVPTINQDGYYPIHVQGPGDKWGPELRIYLPAGIELSLPPGVEVRTGWSQDSVRINNNAFWWRLIRIGFRLGRHHELATIRRTVPPENRANYDAGLGTNP